MVLGANSSSIVMRRSVRPCSCAYCNSASIDGRFLLDAVGKPVGTDDRLLFFQQRLQPGERGLRRSGLQDVVVGIVLGAAQRLVEAQRHPGIALVDVAADHHRVHDRIDLGAPVIVLLELAVVRKQPRDLAGAAAERQRVVRRHHEIDLAALQQIAKLGAGRRLRQADVSRELAAKPVGAALHPFDVGGLHAVLVLQQPAHIDRRRHRIFRHAAALALEVLRRLDALLGVDEEVAVAEHARGKRRDRDERRRAAVHQRGVVRERHLGGVELLVLQHPPEDLRRLQRHVVEVDALRLDGAVPQRLRAVVGSAGQGQSQIGHSHAPVSIVAAPTVVTAQRNVNAARCIADRRSFNNDRYMAGLLGSLRPKPPDRRLFLRVQGSMRERSA